MINIGAMPPKTPLKATTGIANGDIILKYQMGSQINLPYHYQMCWISAIIVLWEIKEHFGCLNIQQPIWKCYSINYWVENDGVSMSFVSSIHTHICNLLLMFLLSESLPENRVNGAPMRWIGMIGPIPSSRSPITIIGVTNNVHRTRNFLGTY